MPPNFRSAADATRSDEEAKLKKRTTKRCDSASSSLAFGPANCCWMKALRVWPFEIGDRHAARVVDQHAEKVLLRDRRLENQRGPEQTEEQHRERGEAQADQHHAIARPFGRRHAAIGQQREHRDGRGRRDRQQHRARQAPGEVALLEHEGRILEQEPKELFHHQALILILERPANVWNVYDAILLNRDRSLT